MGIGIVYLAMHQHAHQLSETRQSAREIVSVVDREGMGRGVKRLENREIFVGVGVVRLAEEGQQDMEQLQVSENDRQHRWIACVVQREVNHEVE